MPPFLGASLVGRGDGASVSSVGSSCSPPPGSEEFSDASERRINRREQVHQASPLPRRRGAGRYLDLDMPVT